MRKLVIIQTKDEIVRTRIVTFMTDTNVEHWYNSLFHRMDISARMQYNLAAKISRRRNFHVRQ